MYKKKLKKKKKKKKKSPAQNVLVKPPAMIGFRPPRSCYNRAHSHSSSVYFSPQVAGFYTSKLIKQFPNGICRPYNLIQGIFKTLMTFLGLIENLDYFKYLKLRLTNICFVYSYQTFVDFSAKEIIFNTNKNIIFMAIFVKYPLNWGCT